MTNAEVMNNWFVDLMKKVENRPWLSHDASHADELQAMQDVGTILNTIAEVRTKYIHQLEDEKDD